jgi:hypothetical protein
MVLVALYLSLWSWSLNKNKNMKKVHFAFLISLAVLAFASCKKDVETKVEAPSIPTKFSEIKTDPSFNWSTTRVVQVNVKGLKTLESFSNTLTLSSLDKSAVYYSGYHLMSEDVNVKITVPTAQDSMVVGFGSIKKNYSIKQNVVDVDYIISYPEEN